jgi:acyl carrier protein
MGKELFAQVSAAFNAAFGTDPTNISPESMPADIPGWDSLGHVRLVAELEKVFDTTFEVDEVMEMEDVAAILRLLNAKGF